MTVKELKQKLEKLPDNMEVFLSERKTEFSYGLLNSTYVREINMQEDPDGETLATMKVLILDEEIY